MKAMQPAAARHQKPNIGARRLISSAASPDFDPRDQAELLGARGAILVRDALPRREIEIFQSFMLHGTHYRADMSGERYSLEVRICPEALAFEQPLERIHYLYRFATNEVVKVDA